MRLLEILGVSRYALVGHSRGQEIPLDPWGREYLFDGDRGVVMTLGADGELGPGYDYEDEDIVVTYRSTQKAGEPGRPGCR